MIGGRLVTGGCNHANVPPINVGRYHKWGLSIGSNKGKALSEIYGRYLILVKWLIYDFNFLKFSTQTSIL